MSPTSHQPVLVSKNAEDFHGGGDNGKPKEESASRPRAKFRAPRTTTSLAAKRNQNTRAKANTRAPRIESLAAEGKVARPSPPAPMTMASPVTIEPQTGKRRLSAGQCTWRWPLRTCQHHPFRNDSPPLQTGRAPQHGIFHGYARCLSPVIRLRG